MDTHALTWPKEGNSRVPYRVFSDPDIYKSELDRVFLGPTWQFLALADELPNPGDYKTKFLGETPVIVTRGDDGEIHAMVNRCAHRGNLVCLKRRGTCRRADLRLPFVALRPRRQTEKRRIPPRHRRQGRHARELPPRGARLHKLRVDHFAGLVFGTLSPERRRSPNTSAI